MPAPEAEPVRGVFWAWHLSRNPQAFAHPLDAAVTFVDAWRKWVSEQW